MTGTGKLGQAKFGQFKLGDSQLQQQPGGGGFVIGGARVGVGKRIFDEEWNEDEEAMLLFVLTQV
jgi:hypothetical protein